MVSVGNKSLRPVGYNVRNRLSHLSQAPNLKHHNLPSAYRKDLAGYSRLQDTHYKGYTDKDTEKKGLKNPKGAGDFSKKLQFLLKQAGTYNKNISGLRKYSVSQLREAEGMYPEYGQYDKVYNSGWVRTKPSSLKKVDGLSMMDKLVIGDVNPFTKKRDLTKGINNNVTLAKIIRNQDAEGGDQGPRQKHIKNFNKQLIEHLKDYSDLEQLEKRNDPISKLVKTQMENVYDRLEYLHDDKKLQDLTGIDVNEEQWAKKIRSSPLSSPLNTEGRPTTWFKASDHALSKEHNFGDSDRFHYISQYLLNNPLRTYMDKHTKKLDAPVEDLIQPYRSVSKLTQNLISGHQNKLSELAKAHPDIIDPKMREDFLENPEIFGNSNRSVPVGIYGLQNITEQRGDASNNLHKYRPIGIDMIEHFASGNRSKPFNDTNILAQLYNVQKQKSTNSPRGVSSVRSPFEISRFDEYRKMLGV